MEIKKSFTHNITDNSVILICVIRDERLLLEYFIQHYERCGVTHFIFVDNDSEDNSLEYLMSRNDINCLLYHTTDSYAKNNYGITWVNEILDEYCKNKWCVVVDADELLLPRKNKSLLDIKSKMEQNNQNVLPTCLIDFYPKELDNSLYKSGDAFYSHSDHYDKFAQTDYEFRPGEGGELVVKGGMRHRVFGAKREPVCLTKKSFFKYDFSETHKLSVGMHWLFPKDFIKWNTYDNWNETNKYIKYYPDICVLGHFKFIKPNIDEFFNKRVERNQDWGNSNEYKNYIKTNLTSFFNNDISVQYTSVEKIYEDIFDDGINRREFIVVVSAQRHGSTTLCKKLNSVPQSVNLFEAFNAKQGQLYKKHYTDLSIEINEFLDSNDWTNKKYVSFKVFCGHIDLEKLFTCGISLRVVFLKRPLEDSYSSLTEALKTGNWGTNPNKKRTEEGLTGYKLDSDDIIDFETYSKKQQEWFSSTKELVEKYNIPNKEIWFDSVIQKSFDCKNLIVGKW